MKFSFVIPAYNGWAHLHQLLWDIYKNCSIPHEVIVMDNSSTETSFLTGLSWWMEQDMLPIQHVRNMDNIGFLLNSNAGLKLATGDVVCLVSTDVRIHKDVVTIGQALPEIQSRNNGKILLGGRYLNFDTGWNVFNGKMFPYVEGWLLISTRENWKELGYFDERFAPNDYEDVDLSTTAILKGYSIAQITPDNGDVVSHLGGQSIGYGAERLILTEKNRHKFAEKWA